MQIEDKLAEADEPTQEEADEGTEDTTETTVESMAERKLEPNTTNPTIQNK